MFFEKSENGTIKKEIKPTSALTTGEDPVDVLVWTLPGLFAAADIRPSGTCRC